MSQVQIITISGPSLSGKTQLVKILQESYNFNSVTSVTTRPIRTGEIDGKDYYFINEKEFNDLKLVQTTYHSGYNYGVSEKEIINKSNQPLLWVIAPNSIPQVEKYCHDKNFKLTKIFITNPKEVIYERLFERFSNDKNANIKNYVNRLNTIVNHEVSWIEEAINHPEKYDLIFTKFDKENTDEVVLTVLSSLKNEKINKFKIK
jgi:guanylate kinase